MATKAQKAAKGKPAVKVSKVDDYTDEQSSQRFEYLGYAEIPIANVEPNPINPRPTFHLEDDDPQLIAMGESIKIDGQHNPAVVYEIVNHYDDEQEDRPGEYRLYQGERRYRACKAAEVDVLRCLVAPTPQSEAEEWDWLGVEEAFKQDWQDFFFLRYCKRTADAHGIPVYSPEIATKTGATMNQLKTAEKVFKLEPAIQAFAAEYEELMYEQLVKGKRRRGTRLAGSGVRSKEFPVAKAALVYDIFEALREILPKLVKEHSDLELQQLIAQKATRGATLDDLQKLHGQIKMLGKNAPTGLLAQVHDLLNDESKTIKEFNEGAGIDEVKKINRFMQKSPGLRKLVAQTVDVIDNIGNDPDDLTEVQREVLECIRDLSEFDRQLQRRIMDLREDRGSM